MPSEYKDYKMVILCNDCLSESTVPYHIYAGKCKKCNSYNTSKVKEPPELTTNVSS